VIADSPLGDIEKLEKDLWEAADQLRANSKLTSSEYCMPVLGVIFLRHAANRFETATRQIEADQADGRMPKRPLVAADYVKRRALWLPEIARYDHILNLPKDRILGDALIAAMKAIEESFDPLQGVLPKEYGIFERTVLEDLLKIFNREALKTAGGDVFGRIYEYFLMEFAIQGAQDNGEFFTPPSLVQMIVNVIEPGIGQPFNPKAGSIILDPATGSGGMFVQSSHFVERMGLDAAHKLTFYGQEKTRTTINLAKMNLAVHGLQGDVREANTFYEDVHTLYGKCDRVMANPPFNVDMVDAERVKDDVRLPFGLPGVNKAKKVGNGNYLWISYFWSYLNPQGRAGFVMSSQASSAGHGEKDVRRKIIETGAVDVMIAIRANFFYTRTVPCELWFFDKNKPPPSQPSPLPPLPKGEGIGKSAHYRGGYDFAGLVARARELRQTQTPAEDVFWELVRDRRFLGLKFRRQHQFGDYVLDFYCDERHLAVELDGPIHDGRTQKDHKRDAYIVSQGVKVIRIRNEDLLANPKENLEAVALALPLPVGEGRGEGDVALNQKGNVLMLDARGVYRKVTRKIYDFSPEQLANLTAIVWLYRGQKDRFLGLVKDYLAAICRECEAIPAALVEFDTGAAAVADNLNAFAKAIKGIKGIEANQHQALSDALSELAEANNAYAGDRDELLKDIASYAKATCRTLAATNAKQHTARKAFDPIAERVKGLIKQADLIYKLASRGGDAAGTVAASEAAAEHFDRRGLSRLLKDLDANRKAAVEQLKAAAYFHRQVAWLQDRFPDAELVPVAGLVKVVDQKEIEAADWSLTPGRYVGVAPPETDEDFDFEQAIRDIHVELASLNDEAATLAKLIQENFEELGV